MADFDEKGTPTERERRLAAAILDIDAHATPFGSDDDGHITGGYLISVGSLHRALGVVGHAAPKCPACCEKGCCKCADHDDNQALDRTADLGSKEKNAEHDDNEEIALEGWKVSVIKVSDYVRMDAVTDTQPLHRMRFRLDPESAEEIAEDLIRSAKKARERKTTT